MLEEGAGRDWGRKREQGRRERRVGQGMGVELGMCGAIPGLGTKMVTGAMSGMMLRTWTEAGSILERGRG